MLLCTLQDSPPPREEERWATSENQDKRRNGGDTDKKSERERQKSEHKRISTPRLKGLQSFSAMLSENNKSQNKLFKKGRSKVRSHIVTIVTI